MKTQTRIGLVAGLTLALLGGLAPRAEAVSAAGGDATNVVDGFRIHTFTNVGASIFNVSAGGVVEVLVVAGGGGGGSAGTNKDFGSGGGGGGAGGLIYSNAFTVGSGSIAVTVGGGGAGGSAAGAAAANGGNSVFSNLTAVGGGRGASAKLHGASNGGSGGGGATDYLTKGNGTASQGKDGGAGNTNTDYNRTPGGSGGGAGAAGSNAPNTYLPAQNGGSGLSNSISGTPTAYAGGGGSGTGGWWGGGSSGGAGGGGSGGGGSVAGGAGTTSRGGGGGGGGCPTNDARIAGGKGGSGVVIVRYLMDAATPEIQNLTPSGVTTNGAMFNGHLVSTGASPVTVYAAWGEANGAAIGGWASTNWFDGNAWTNGSPLSTNMTLEPNRNYYYTFGATNGTTNVVASGFQYLITGGLTVQATDPLGRTNISDTAAFTVFRPDTCTNEDLVVNYTLGGTASNGADYAIAPASGAVILVKGQTNGIITVTPMYRQEGAKTVILTLTPGAYAIGSQNAATCTLAKVTGTDRYWVGPVAGNWNSTANWSDETGGAGGLSVPGSGNRAIFDGGGTNDCTLNADVDVAGIRLASGYAGTVTQGVGRTAIVGASGYAQYAGAFAGSAASITINGSFLLAGGNFTSTSGRLTVTENWTYSGGTFAHNKGTVAFTPAYSTTRTISGSATLWNLGISTWGGATTLALASGTTQTVERTFTISYTDDREIGFSINTGTIEAKGDIALSDPWVSRVTLGTARLLVSGTNEQTLACSGGGLRLAGMTVNKSSGTARMTGNWTVGNITLAAGTFESTANKLTVYGNWVNSGCVFLHNRGTVDFGAGTYDTGDYSIDVAATQTFHNLTVNVDQYYSSGNGIGELNIAAGDTIVVLGTLSQTGGSINTGTLDARGNVYIGNTDAFTGAYGGSSPLFLTGTNVQAITHASGTPVAGTWTIDKSDGSVTLATSLSLSSSGQKLVWTNGALNLSSNTLTVAGATTIYPGATTLGVTVADATKAGRLTVTDALSGLANAALEVSVAATLAQVEGRTYTILSNASALSPPFESVSWVGRWTGSVAYSANSGKNVTLSNIRPAGGGAIFVVR